MQFIDEARLPVNTPIASYIPPYSRSNLSAAAENQAPPFSSFVNPIIVEEVQKYFAGAQDAANTAEHIQGGTALILKSKKTGKPLCRIAFEDGKRRRPDTAGCRLLPFAMGTTLLGDISLSSERNLHSLPHCDYTASILRISLFGRAPTILFTTFTSCTTARVGILITPNCCAISGSSSTLTLQIFAFFTSEDNSSITGAIMRQGPHQLAQKSMSTGTYESMTSCLKVCFVTLIAIPDTPLL